jgi:hypothetical protein
MHIELDHQPNEISRSPPSLVTMAVGGRAVDPAVFKEDLIALPSVFRLMVRDPAPFDERVVRRLGEIGSPHRP